MPIYKGNTKIGTIYRGGTVIGQVYKGSQLVYSSRNFPAEQIIVNSAVGNETGTFTLKSTQRFYVEMYGGGAGGSSSQRDKKWFYGPGGSGAGFAGIIKLPAGTYTWTVGAAGYGYNINNTLNMSGSFPGGDSTLINTTTGQTFVLAGGAPANYAPGVSNGVAIKGAGGTITVKDDAVVSYTKKSNGNYGGGDKGNVGGESLFDNTLTGYGAGNNSFINGGTRYAVAGFVQIKAL